MTDDELLATALCRAVSTLEPPITQLVDGGLARGRRRRRMRRSLQAASGAVLIAAVAALALTLLPGGASTPDRHSSVGAPMPSSTRHASPSLIVLPVVTPQALLKQALSGLPRPGRTTHYTGRSTLGFVGVEFVYDDGHGAAKIAIGLEHGPGTETATQFCHDTRQRCERRADGSTLATHRGHTRPGDPSTAREWTADLFRSDGVHLSMIEWNSAEEKDAATTRPAPPFTIAALTRWIVHTHWQDVVTSEQARRASGLFTPDPSNSPDPATPLTTATLCASAAKAGSGALLSCASPR